MSTIINATTTNGVVIQPDNSGSLVLQTNSGTTALTIDTSQNATFAGTLTATGKLASSSMPTGSVLQVVNAVTGTQASTVGGTLVDTNLTASITPSSSSNKILVLVNQFGGKDGNCAYKIRLLRGATDIGGSDYVMFTNTILNVQGLSYSLAVLDNPSTTSSTTYKTQIAISTGSGTVYAQVNNGQSSITLMEIKG
jgi:hypothetical protein